MSGCSIHSRPLTHDVVTTTGSYVRSVCDDCLHGLSLPPDLRVQGRLFAADKENMATHTMDNNDVGNFVTRAQMTAVEQTDRRQKKGDVIEYVVGFLFDDARRVVVLLEKQKPLWQKGKLNGVGGKIEAGETPYQAMHREFEEETGVRLGYDRPGRMWAHDEATEWLPFCVLKAFNGSPDLRCVVHFFRAFAPLEVLSSCRSMTPEKVSPYVIRQLGGECTMNNLPWLIPMALGMERERVQCFEVIER
jgi:8-oxo-dGTP diphosphatase